MNLSAISEYKPRTRSFLPVDYVIDTWESLQPYVDQLLAEDPQELTGLIEWMQKLDELNAVIGEDAAWRYIHMSCDSLNEDKQAAYQDFVQNIGPHLSLYDDRFNQKIHDHPAFHDLPADYHTFSRSLSKQLELFREENIPISTELATLGQRYGTLNAGMTIEHEGGDITLQQAQKKMDNRDRDLRESIWVKIFERRMQDREEIETIFDEMISLRHQKAINAGYENFSAFRFDERGRFDYSIADTRSFHDTVEQVVKPVVESFHRERKEKLGLDRLRPFDLQVDVHSETPLTPFKTADELLDGAVRILSRLKPELASMLLKMKEKRFLDLDSRKGKMPGGYNYPLMETGIPFIFMNAAGSSSDVITLLHESGHAVHSFLTRELPVSQRNVPSEVAELAAMTMELLCLDLYDEFYADPEERKRAQKNQLSRCISVLSWIATVDAFQLWVYDHPGHSREERGEAWKNLYFRFHGDVIDWCGYEQYIDIQWMKQPHIFEYPFYYIEYGLAQLGALSIWKNYRQDPEKSLAQYLSALSLGYTKPIPAIYQEAGIRFDFSQEYVKESVEFCLATYRELS